MLARQREAPTVATVTTPHAGATTNPQADASARALVPGASARAVVMGPQWVLAEAERSRDLRDYYDVPDVELGKGHYGVVRAGVRKADGARVAVKSVIKRRAAYTEMPRAEVALLRAVDHHAVIKLLDAFEDEKQVYLVFERCAGGELFAPVADTRFRFTERQASRLLRQLLGAMQHIHAAGVCHRDLKPENLLLSAPGVDSDIKIIDFGLAARVTPSTVLTSHVGTPYYIAPDVLKKSYNIECDAWSIGVILFTILGGYPPFFGDTEAEIYRRIREGRVQFEGPEWAGRSSACKDLILRLLRQDPVKRLTVAEALAHPWVVHEGEIIDPRSRRVFARLRVYAQFPLLKRLALVAIARRLSPAQRAYTRDVYDTLETGDEGVLTVAALTSALHARSLFMTDYEVRSLFGALDVDADGVLSHAEVAASVMPRLLYLEAPNAGLDAFEELDADGDGVISASDLAVRTTPALAAEAVAEATPDGAGAVTLGEFLDTLAAGEAHNL